MIQFFLLLTAFLSFDQSMSKGNPQFADHYEQKHANKWEVLKNLYEKTRAAEPKATIPKVIHQIWIGGPLPEKYLPLQKTWKEKNPGWEYRLWTDADLPNFPFTNRKRFERANNIGEKADILRYEILNHYGGLYIDLDFECIQSFDPIHALADFYVGVEASPLAESEPSIGNALIASVPNHPILTFCLKRISSQEPGKTPNEVQSISGPCCLRRAFFKHCNKGPLRNVAFPYTYFYPIPTYARDGALGKKVKKNWVQTESFGVHYWDTSWADQF